MAIMKMRCVSVTPVMSSTVDPRDGSSALRELYSVQFTIEPDGSAENAAFFGGSPAGAMLLTMVRDNQFVAGTEYFIGFGLVPDAAQILTAQAVGDSNVAVAEVKPFPPVGGDGVISPPSAQERVNPPDAVSGNAPGAPFAPNAPLPNPAGPLVPGGGIG